MIKNAGPLRLWAGRLCGLLADGLVGGCLAAGGCLPFWGPERQRGRDPPPGLLVVSMSARGRGDGLPGMDGAGNDPAAILLYLISN